MCAVNYVDLVIILLLLAAASYGIVQGAAVQIFSFAGFWGGFALGVVVAPSAARLVTGPFARALVPIAVVFGLAALLGGVGRQIGVHIWSTLHRMRLGPADALVGSGVAVVTNLLAVWLIGGMLASVPVPGISTGIHESRIVGALARTLPPAPAVVSQLSRYLYSAGFPPVFAQLEPQPSAPVELPGDDAFQDAVAAARDSTVKIVGFGCGGELTGSGFVAAPGLVVTNAHVVAGISRPFVEDPRGRRSQATPVLFDPGLDLAILRAPGLNAPPLELVRAPVDRGAGGAVLGYPGGGPLSASGAAVLNRISDAVGRDIYNRGTVNRDVYQLQTVVRAGNSGGPFVRPTGDVAGVIFSRSAIRSDVGYALVSTEVAPRLDQARNVQGSASTGACAA